MVLREAARIQGRKRVEAALQCLLLQLALLSLPPPQHEQVST